MQKTSGENQNLPHKCESYFNIKLKCYFSQERSWRQVGSDWNQMSWLSTTFIQLESPNAGNQRLTVTVF